MKTTRRKLGDDGEKQAVLFLKEKGFRILARQERTLFGEIDIVCLDGKEIVLVEVKTRRTNQYGRPEDSITPTKFAHMAASAHVFLVRRGWTTHPWRLDVVAVTWPMYKDPILMHYRSVDSPSSA